MIENAWLAWLILLFPLGAFLVAGLLGRRLREGGGHVAVGAMAVSFVLSLYLFVQVLAQGGLGGTFPAQTVHGYIWIPSIGGNGVSGNDIEITLLLDNLSSLMLVLVSFLCLLIFVYSLGYMHEEEGKPRYYAEVSLFATGMLGTVSAANFLQLLIFWALMGELVTLIPLLLFGGAVGKSAQFPLHAWLPDAMEGPTTVSALIHAATMVKAGVYLTARAFVFLVPIAPGVEPPYTAILVIAAIGGFTALFAATMAVVNVDIKRVLAFSTISQLAYMFLGLRAGAFLMATEGSRGREVNSAGYSAAL